MDKFHSLLPFRPLFFLESPLASTPLYPRSLNDLTPPQCFSYHPYRDEFQCHALVSDLPPQFQFILAYFGCPKGTRDFTCLEQNSSFPLNQFLLLKTQSQLMTPLFVFVIQERILWQSPSFLRSNQLPCPDNFTS